MAEIYPTTSELDALSSSVDAQTGLYYSEKGTGYDWYAYFAKMIWTAIKAVFPATGCRVYKDGDETFGVREGKWLDGDTIRTFSAVTGQTLTNNATNYIYLTADGTLTKNTTGFPSPSTTPHIPLAQIVKGASGVAYSLSDITDCRREATLRVLGGDQEVDTIDVNGNQIRLVQTTNDALIAAADQANQTNTYTIPDADANKYFAMTGESDGTIGNSEIKADAGIARSKLEETSLQRYQISLMADARNADGTVLDATGSDSNFKINAGGWGSGTLTLDGPTVQNTTKTTTLAFEFCLPAEYQADQDVQLVVHAKYDDSGGGTSPTCTVDAEVYELGDDGTVGSDLNSTAEITLTTTFADSAITITDTGITAGERLMCLVRTSITEGGDTGTLQAVIGSVEIQCDIKG